MSKKRVLGEDLRGVSHTRDERLALAETFGSVCWFFMDAAWMVDWTTVARLLVVPTVLVNLAVFVWTERRLAHFAVTAAVNAWVGMNVTWMIEDLGGSPIFGVVARVFGVAGVVLIGMALVASPWRETARIALRRFRRLRVR